MFNSTEHKVFLLINVKMTTVVGILAFISRINTKSENFKATHIFIFLAFFEQLKFQKQLN